MEEVTNNLSKNVKLIEKMLSDQAFYTSYVNDLKKSFKRDKKIGVNPDSFVDNHIKGILADYCKEKSIPIVKSISELKSFLSEDHLLIYKEALRDYELSKVNKISNTEVVNKMINSPDYQECLENIIKENYQKNGKFGLSASAFASDAMQNKVIKYCRDKNIPYSSSVNELRENLNNNPKIKNNKLRNK